MLRQPLGLKAFDSHKVTYDIHRRHEGNPKVSIHLVNRLPGIPFNPMPVGVYITDEETRRSEYSAKLHSPQNISVQQRPTKLSRSCMDMLFDLSALVPCSEESTARPTSMLNVFEGIHHVRYKAKEAC
jgi:hypothetical protein